MTANQIAYASEREQERHNLAVENENQRHNEATEEIQGRHDSWENDWHITANNIQRDYNDYLKQYNNAKLELEKADAENKWIYQQEMADAQSRIASTQQQLADTDKYYKTILGYVEQDKADEIARHNLEVESINRASNALNAKKLEFEKHQWDTENIIAFKRLSLDERKFQQAINVDTWNIRRDAFNLEIAKQNAESNLINAQASKTSSEAQQLNAEASWLNAQRNQELKAYDKWNSISQTFNNFSRGLYADTMAAVTVFKPSFVNNAVKYSAKEAAKLLFKD